MKRSCSLLTGLLLAGLTLPAAAETSKQKQLQLDIQQLSSNLDARRGESGALQGEVTRLEKKLGEISRQYHQTEKKMEDTQARLQETNQQKQSLDAALAEQKAGMAQQLQALYTAGEQSHLRLLLRQDDPSDISRTVHYFAYLNKSRFTRIQKIQETLQKIETLRTAADKDRAAMQELNHTLEAQKTDIQTTLAARADALQGVNRDIRSKEKQLAKLRQEEAALQGVVERLAREAETKARTRSESSKAEPAVTKPEPDTSRTPKVEQTVEQPDTVRLSPDKPFSTLRGKLAWPVAGRIIHSYNSARNEKQRWRGVVISASGGTRVRAVAQGRVAFAGWMDGYGHLIILEHDNNYMSLYGYNRTLYKQEGDIVRANEAIASVGNSSGQSQDGLYFEIRQGTTPQNPARWCR